LNEPADPQQAISGFLADPRTHGLDQPVGRIDTAGAIVFLAGPNAYKVKRAVKFPFMDLSTLEERRKACEAEITVNRENAPGVYLEALPIVRDRQRLKLGGKGEIVEWVVHMRRFNESATLDRVADRGGVTGAIIDELALAIRCSHARAPRRDATKAAHALETYILQNDAAFAERPDLFAPAAARRLTQETRLAFAIARPVLLARGALGFTRRCHGDLHLRNIVLIDGEPTLFDAVEFSDEVASGDVLYDLAFLLMDLEGRGLRSAANRLFNRYMAPEAPEAISGLAALPLFLSLRAAIRAKVEAAGADRLDGEARGKAQGLARRYFALAADMLRYLPPRLVAIGGLSGSGKSALAGRLAPRLGRPPGALWLRSDVERKLMYGVTEGARLPDAAYASEVSREVYQRIDDKARRALKAGCAVVLDATFSTAAQRKAAASVAAEVGVAFDGLYLNAALDTRLARVGARSADASDADAEVARRQRAEPLGERGWLTLDAEGSLEQTTALADGLLAA
jgi:uncharacterized protein